MHNQEISKILFELAELYEMKNVPLKPRALLRASETIDSLGEDVADIYKKGEIKALENIPGVGRGIAEKIEEYLKTGHIKEYEHMKKKMPVDIAGLSSIEGVGPKLINLLYTRLRIRTVSDLEKAAKEGKLRNLPRMGEKLEQKILKGKKNIAAEFEEKIYKKLGMDLPPSEIRLNLGEIEAALRGKLPRLIGYGDLKGDLQLQTTWTDGKHTIEEMAREAEKIGHEYIAITDHTRSLAMTGGADEKKLERQMAEIDKINAKLKNQKSKLTVLKGAEVNIMKDGSLDIDNKTLEKLDVVGAAVHSLFNLSREEQTARIVKTMENPNVDILFHPTGRVINKRKPYDIDMEKLIKTAKRTGTILEIDGHPWRLDLKDEHIRMAREAGVKMVIDTDAHSIYEMSYLEYGVAQARRGWCEKKDIINTLPLKEFLKALK